MRVGDCHDFSLLARRWPLLPSSRQRDNVSMSKCGVSQPVRRVEDARLLIGSGCYTDDQTPIPERWAASRDQGRGFGGKVEVFENGLDLLGVVTRIRHRGSNVLGYGPRDDPVI